MTGPAILLLVASILIIWGGLIGSIISLKRVPAPFEVDATVDNDPQSGVRASK